MSHTAPTTDQVTATMGEGTANPEPFADRLHVLAQEIREGGPQAFVTIVKRNQILSLTVVSTLLLFIAGLGPQIQSTHRLALGSFTIGAVQTHPLVPGWIYVILALAAGAGLAQLIRTGVPEWLMLTRLATGLSGIAVLIALFQSVVTSAIGLRGDGWGFYLAWFSTSCLTFVTAVLHSRIKRTGRA